MRVSSKTLAVAIVAAICVWAAAASADPITHVSADTVYTYFDPDEGPGLGRLDLEGNTLVEFDYGPSTCVAYNPAYVHVWTDLAQDNSTPSGLADGHFTGGGFVIKDDSNNVLLEGDLLWLDMCEVYDNCGFMSGLGFFEITGGSLADDFGTMGEIFNMTFEIDPSVVNDFGAYFDGDSNLTIIPTVPEPSTIVMISASIFGVAGLLLRKRNS